MRPSMLVALAACHGSEHQFGPAVVEPPTLPGVPFYADCEIQVDFDYQSPQQDGLADGIVDETEVWSYTSEGYLEGMTTDANGDGAADANRTYEYDGRGHVVLETWYAGTEIERKITYRYGRTLGLVTSAETYYAYMDAVGDAVTYTYDDGRLALAEYDHGAPVDGEPDQVLAYTYNAVGDVATASNDTTYTPALDSRTVYLYGGGLLISDTTIYGEDPADAVQTTYTQDARGRLIAKEVDGSPIDGTLTAFHAYAYDDLDRILSEEVDLANDTRPTDGVVDVRRDWVYNEFGLIAAYTEGRPVDDLHFYREDYSYRCDLF